MLFYVKPNSNCGGQSLVDINDLLGGQWEEKPCWRGQPLIKTGEDLTPRQIVGWSSLFSGSAVDLSVYRRVDQPAFVMVGADWGVRILANEDELDDYEPSAGAEHLPPGWGMACMTVYEQDDVLDDDLRRHWPNISG